MEKKKSPPKSLQPLLWSQNVKTIDLEKDAASIIHRILAYGDLKDIKWLFKTYSRSTIIENFKKKPINIYTKPAFNFTVKTLLNIKQPLSKSKYVKNISGSSR